jgi:hypothetical protein
MNLFYQKQTRGVDPNPQTVGLRCPACRLQGTFEPITSLLDAILDGGTERAGIRRCPTPTCKAIVFIVREYQSPSVIAAYPAERIDFDAVSIPTAVLSAFNEAVTCHAGECYVAAAIMVRKTLEELCHDKGATGANLRDRLKHLRTTGKVILPDELFDGLDDLRLLGNDAAHIESKEFNQVGKEEAEVGIDFAKEVLKAVYQLSALLGRLRALRKP